MDIFRAGDLDGGQPFKMQEPNPDELLKSLDAELARAKAKRMRSGDSRRVFRAVSILIFLIAVLGALGVLQYLLSQLPAHPPAGKPSATVQPK